MMTSVSVCVGYIGYMGYIGYVKDRQTSSRQQQNVSTSPFIVISMKIIEKMCVFIRKKPHW